MAQMLELFITILAQNRQNVTIIPLHFIRIDFLP